MLSSGLDPSDRAALSRARVNLAALRHELALMRWARIILYRSYDPNQPRVPAGSSEGGRWAGSDGGVGRCLEAGAVGAN